MIAQFAEAIGYSLSISVIITIVIVSSALVSGVIQVSTQIADSSIYFLFKLLGFIFLLYWGFDTLWNDLLELAVVCWTLVI